MSDNLTVGDLSVVTEKHSDQKSIDSLPPTLQDKINSLNAKIQTNALIIDAKTKELEEANSKLEASERDRLYKEIKAKSTMKDSELDALGLDALIDVNEILYHAAASKGKTRRRTEFSDSEICLSIGDLSVVTQKRKERT